MLADKVIRPSQSPWASPVVLVGKKDGSVRFCVDYRKLNLLTKKDVYPLPRIDDSLSALGAKQVYTTLDLTSGYWQIPIAEEDKEKTAFVTHKGLFEFNVMPFGLCNAPATFQRYMDAVFAGLKWECCLVFGTISSLAFSKFLELRQLLEELRSTYFTLCVEFHRSFY